MTELVFAVAGLLVAASAFVLIFMSFRRDSPKLVPELFLGTDLSGARAIQGRRHWGDWLRHPWSTRSMHREGDQYFSDDENLFVQLQVSNDGRRETELTVMRVILGNSTDDVAIVLDSAVRLREHAVESAEWPIGEFIDLLKDQATSRIVAVEAVDALYRRSRRRVPRRVSDRIQRIAMARKDG